MDVDPRVVAIWELVNGLEMGRNDGITVHAQHDFLTHQVTYILQTPFLILINKVFVFYSFLFVCLGVFLAFLVPNE